MEHKKLVKFARTLDVVARVVRKAMLIACIVCAVFAVLVAVFGGKVMEPDSFDLKLGFAKLHLVEQYQNVTPLKQAYISVELVSVCVFLFCAWHGLGILCRILAPMKEGKPFAPDTPMSIGRISWLVFIGGTIMQVLSVASQVLMVLAFPLDQVLGTQSITELDLTFQIDFGFVFAFLVLRLMAYVFAYGQSLQQSNENA